MKMKTSPETRVILAEVLMMPTFRGTVRKLVDRLGPVKAVPAIARSLRHRVWFNLYQGGELDPLAEVLLKASLCRVDWLAIAENIIAED